MSGRRIWITLTALAALTGMTGTLAHAEHLAQNNRGTGAKLYRAGEPTVQHKIVEYRITRGGHPTGVYVVIHEVQDRVVTKAKAAKAIHKPRYIRVRAHNNTLILDRHRDYVTYDRYSKDGQYMLPLAQSIGNYYYDGKASIIWGGPVDAMPSPVDIKPLMIIENPNQGPGIDLRKQVTLRD